MHTGVQPAIRHSSCTRVQPMDDSDTPAGVYHYCCSQVRVGQVGQSVGRSVGRSVFPSQPSFFMQARCLSRSVENVQCSEYMHCFPQNEDSKSLPVSLGCEGWPGPIQSHRIVQCPRVLAVPLPDTRYMLHVLYTVYTVQHAYPSRSPGPEVCIPGCTRCSARLLLLLLLLPNFAQWGSYCRF